MDYIDIGFTKNFQRKVERQVQPEELPDLTSFTMDSILQGISGSKVEGGIIKSQSGKLIIDLDNDRLVYNDGVVDLLNIGGEDNNVLIKSSDDDTLLTSSS